MEIYKKDYFKIFKANFNYEIVDTNLARLSENNDFYGN